MSSYLDTCCSRFYKKILVFFNACMFIVGLLVTILAIVLKYDKNFKELINLKELNTILNVGEINSITILFLAIGIFVMVLSMIGLFGLLCLSKILLITYEAIIVILFISHGIGLLVLVFGKSKIENEFGKGMVKLVNNLNTLNNASNAYIVDRDIMKALSTTFACCGDQSSKDFLNNTAPITDFCTEKTIDTDVGCTKKVIDDLTKYASDFLIIPSCVILLVELFIMILTPIITGRIKNSTDKEPFKGFKNYSFKSKN